MARVKIVYFAEARCLAMRRLAHRYPSLSWVCFLLALLSLGNALKVSLFENIAG